MKDPEHLIKVEKAIQEKYGHEAIQNPKANWSPQKEKKYLEEIKKIYKEQKPKEKIEVDGVLMPKKLFRKESKRTCPSCNVYTRKIRDDMYMTKFNCCHGCYVRYVEGREEEWFKKMENNKHV